MSAVDELRRPTRRELRQGRIEVEFADGHRQTVAGENVGLLVSGTGIVQEWRTQVSRERKFSLGRALITGGLVLGKTRQTVSQELSWLRDQDILRGQRGRDLCIIDIGSLDRVADRGE